MARKLSMSFEEHKALGENLNTARETLMDAGMVIAKHYNKTANESRKIFKVLDDLDMVRCLLDDRVFDEHREKTTGELTRVYYPGGRG
ncbi:MAG: hypothetical protein M0Q43_00595 [Methanothrix sp.]|jgi:hypothetical protein|uniref:hypothetical protein n=1 Tax=Methanothrix sp. TaxID=90426 RepID=UPI0025F0DC5E|nr:hypothetical protein [Methanothrix sp.]MCK9404984.1 hypothetical protein [Methanothrix sp.]MCK9564528.1 hypothetical protein [Methanothrix sp.]